MAQRVLVVDDDPQVVHSLDLLLRTEGYQVSVAHNGPEALAAVECEQPDLVLLDLVLPGLGGMEVCRRLRQSSQVPVIMLTARSDEIDTVLGLEAGADDYVTKPFKPRELLARIRALLRRALTSGQEQGQPEQLAIGPLLVDAGSREVIFGERKIATTPKEFDLLYTLALHAGRVLEREYLLEQVWGETLYLDSRTLDVHIRRLRLKLEADPSKPRYLRTVPGIGYRLDKAELLAEQPGHLG